MWETKRHIPLQPYKELTFAADGKLEVPVEVITLGNVALVAGKPEINTITERQMQERSRYPHTLYVSMVDGGMKYMPDLDSYRRISWDTGVHADAGSCGDICQYSSKIDGGKLRWQSQCR